VKRALVVDDDSAIRSLVATVLQLEGFDVAVAADGIEAVERLREDDFDIVVLDLMMPRLDGQGVIETVARERGQSLPPFLIMTAAAAPVVERLPRELVHGVLPKPFELGVLRRVVCDALAG
jgi:CheY-like chemotaxis protein